MSKKIKKNIIVIGSGKLGSQIANDFSLGNNNVVLIDHNENILKIIGAKFGGKIVLGDATNINTLIKAGIEQADVVVASTNSDNINIFISLIAKEIYNIKIVISRLYDSMLSVIYDKLNITTICPYILSAEAIRSSILKETLWLEKI